MKKDLAFRLDTAICQQYQIPVSDWEKVADEKFCLDLATIRRKSWLGMTNEVAFNALALTLIATHPDLYIWALIGAAASMIISDQSTNQAGAISMLKARKVLDDVVDHLPSIREEMQQQGIKEEIIQEMDTLPKNIYVLELNDLNTYELKKKMMAVSQAMILWGLGYNPLIIGTILGVVPVVEKMGDHFYREHKARSIKADLSRSARDYETQEQILEEHTRWTNAVNIFTVLPGFVYAGARTIAGDALPLFMSIYNTIKPIADGLFSVQRDRVENHETVNAARAMFGAVSSPNNIFTEDRWRAHIHGS